MAKFMGNETVQADRLDRSIEVSPPEVSDPQDATAWRAEHYRVRFQIGDVFGEHVAQEARNGNCSRLVCLWGAEDSFTIDFLRHFAIENTKGIFSMKPCPYCGGEMPAPKRVGRPRRFCSDDCRNRARGRTDAEIAHDLAVIADLNGKWRRLMMGSVDGE
jgi:hypothetical protein